MRKVVGFEGKGPSGHTVIRNAISMDSQFVPVHYGNDLTRVLGKAWGLMRGNGNSLTMEVELELEYRFKLNLDDYEIHMALKDLVSEPSRGGKLLIRRGVIQAVALFPKSSGTPLKKL